MSQLALVLAAAAAETEENVLPFPPIVFAAIAFAVFVFLAFVVWSYRDVSNRSGKNSGEASGHAPGNATTDHH